MASGFKFNGTDLDSILAPQHAGWPVAAVTGFVDYTGNDINLRYAALSTGSEISADLEFKLSSGADLRTVFAALGSTGVQVATQPGNISGSANAGASGTVTSNTTTCAGTKGGGTYTYTWHVANGSGFSFTAPNSATTAVTGTVPASQAITGAIYCTISDGVTSVNTNTVSISLQNTYMLVSVGTQPANVSGSSAAGNPSGTVTSASATCSGANGDGSYSYIWHTTGCTANSPNSATTDFYATVNAASTDNASAYCTISDGISSANTNTIAVTLQNTSPANPLFTITAAQFKNSSGQLSNYYGYATNAQAYYGGTLDSVSGFENGATTFEIFDDTQTVLAIFGISGVASDPGQLSLESVTINGVTLTGASATSYTSLGTGYYQWEWMGSTFNLVAGDVYNGTAVRNGNPGW